MHAVIRRYNGAAALIEALDRKQHEVESLMASVAGFVAYHAVRSGDTLVTVSIFNDHAGTEESTRRAAEWVRDNLPFGSVSAPEVMEGDVFVDLHSPRQSGLGGVRV